MLEAVARRILRAVFGSGSDISSANPLPVTSEGAIDSGTATGGTNATLIDTTKDWEVNIWEDAILEVEIGGIQYTRTCVSNTANVITFNALPVGIVVAAGCVYSLKRAASPLSPLSKGIIHNTVVLALANFFGVALTPTNSPCLFRIMGAFSAAGVLFVTITRAGNTQTLNFNQGAPLNIGSLYIFDFLVNSGDTINFQYSVGATIQVFRVQEIVAATQ